MNNSEKKFLFNLLSAPSPTGFETEGQKVWVKYMKKYAQYEEIRLLLEEENQ